MTAWSRGFLGALVSRGYCLAGSIVLPSAALKRDGVVTTVYRMGGEATGKGELAVKWTVRVKDLISGQKFDCVIEVI